MPKTKSKIKKQATEDGSRRYKQGEFPSYDNIYSEKLKNSYILNENVRQRNRHTAFSLSGLAECKGVLASLVGNPEQGNRYFDGVKNQWLLAAIPVAKQKLHRVYKKYQLWQEKQVTSGNYLEKPDHWPEDLAEEAAKAQALLDVRRREKIFVKQRIEELKEQKGETEDEKQPMLPWGPTLNLDIKEWETRTVKHQSGKSHKRTFRVDRVLSVDGQNVNYHSSGKPYINDEDSPYDQMPIATYKQMSKNWMKENRIRRMDLVHRRNEFKEKMMDAGLEDEIPRMFSVSKFEAMIKGETTFKGQENWPDFKPWPDAPEWPEGVKSIDEIEDEA